MDIAAILGTAFGLAFVYLLLSLVCSTIQEWIAGILRRRAANLKEGLLALLGNKVTLQQLFTDPMLQSMMSRGIFTAKPKPKSLAYLPADRFSTALLNQFAVNALSPAANLEAEIQNITHVPLRNALLPLVRRAAGDRDRFLELVQKWYDDTMERVSGWYKRESQLIIIVIATVVTIFANVDTSKIVSKLYNDPLARERVAAMADQWLAENAPKPGAPPVTDKTSKQLREEYDKYINKLDETKLPMWWKSKSFAEWRTEFGQVAGSSWYGWLLTIIALSLGAPFWFDVLMKIANLRANGRKPPRESEV